MFFKKKYLVLSIISGSLFCTGIHASAASSISFQDMRKANPFEFFKEHLSFKHSESDNLSKALSDNPTETEDFIRGYKNSYDYKAGKRVTNDAIEVDLLVLYKILLLTKLGDPGSFLKDAFKLNNNILTWNDFAEDGAIDKFIKGNILNFGDPFIIELITDLYSKGLIPQDKLNLLASIIGEYIIRRIGFVTPSGFEVLFKEIIEAILSSYPNGKTAPLDGLSKESGQGLSLNAQSDQRIELNGVLNNKITGFLTRDYSLIEKIAGYLQKAIDSNEKKMAEFGIGEQILALWKQIVDEEKAKLNK